VVLDAPQHLEAEWLREVTQAQVVEIDLLVALGLTAALEDRRVAHTHGAAPPGSSSSPTLTLTVDP
jgi:hypothetical protein